MDFTALQSLIKEADTITIFRHGHPDCDALGSQFGLKMWLTENFPDKKVYALGNDTCTQADWPKSDVAADCVIQSSLAIVLDTANQARVDDERFASAKRIAKVDHHPNREPFGDPCLVCPEAAATCEILTGFFREHPEYKVSSLTAMYLYRGLLTDTLCYRTNNTTAATLSAGSWLAEHDIDIPAINRELFDQSLKDYRFENHVRSSYEVMGDKLAYRIISRKEQEEWGYTPSAARNFIDAFGHVKEFEAWCIFTEKVEDGKSLYDGSLRSKHACINDLAERYNGGGHPNACGVKNLTSEDVKALLSSLFERI